MFLLTPISNCGQSSERLSSRFSGERMGERALGPCVRPASMPTIDVATPLHSAEPRWKFVRAYDLHDTSHSAKGGVLCRLRCRRRTPNLESGRERPRRLRRPVTRPVSKRGRSRPDVARNLRRDVGGLRPRVVPPSRAPLTDTVARLGRRLAGSFATQGGPAAWH